MTSPRGFDEAYAGLFTIADRVARRILGDAAAAQDVAAETLARALVSWAKVHRYAEPWVIRTATNLSLDAVRRKRRAVVPAGPPSLESASPEVTDRTEVLDGLRRLSRRQGQVVAMRYLVGLDDDDDIADALSMSPETVKIQLERGLAALRDHLRGDDEEVEI